MIGSHNTYTYLKSTFWVYNIVKKYWKCQGKTIEEQYKFGVRFFDIRIFRDGSKWRACHGMSNFKKTWTSVQEICYDMKFNYPEAIYRIVLEKGCDSKLYNEIDKTLLHDIYPNLWRIDIKASGKWMGTVYNNNEGLFDSGYKFAKVNTWELPSHELRGNAGLTKDLRKEAKKINGGLSFFKDKKELKKMIKSKDELYLIDYCTNEY